MALGIDAHRERELARIHAEQDAREAWWERVDERAEELQAEDPGLEWEEAQECAEEQLREEDRKAEEAYWDSVAYERGMG